MSGNYSLLGLDMSKFKPPFEINSHERLRTFFLEYEEPGNFPGISIPSLHTGYAGYIHILAYNYKHWNKP